MFCLSDPIPDPCHQRLSAVRFFRSFLCVPQPALSDPELAKGESNGWPLRLISPVFRFPHSCSVASVSSVVKGFWGALPPPRSSHRIPGHPTLAWVCEVSSPFIPLWRILQRFTLKLAYGLGVFLCGPLCPLC